MIMAFVIAPAANADDATPNPATQPVVTATTTDPSPDTVAATTPVSEAPAPVVAPAPAVQAPVAVKSLAVQSNNDKYSPETAKKVFVCKYVGTPGVDERLQTGQNPISVSVQAIQHNEWNGVVPGYFSDAHHRSYVLAYDTGQAKPDVSTCPTPVGPPPVVKKQEVGVYIYPLRDVTKAPSWENSGTQIFCQSKDGTDWFTSITCTLPPQVCGTGWGYQQDKVQNWAYDGAFKWPASIQYPVDNIGWPPIYASQHGLLSTLTTVPDCAPPPPTDVCKNLAGDQATAPVGFHQDGVNCVPDQSNVCTASTVDASVWSTEDGAPTTGTDGADFSTPTAADKVNFFGRTLNVPFSGITGGSYTVKNTGGPIAAYDMEVWQTGTSSFATIVFEPYVNGLTGTGTSGDGTFHTYTITPTSLVWNSKIVSGEGSQAQPVTLTRMQELIPAATLIRAGLGQGRNNAGSLSTVSNFTDPACGHTEFPKLPPTVVEPTASISAGECYYNADQDLSFKPISLTFDNTKSNKAVDFTVSAPYGDLSRTVPAGETVTVQAQDGWQNGVGYEVTANGQTFELNIPAFESCKPAVPTVTPENVWFHDSCGVSDDSVNPPGTLDGTPSVTKNPVTGDVVTRSSYTSSQGVYVVVDTTTKAGVRTAEVTFIPTGNATIAEPGASDTYKVVTIDGVKYAQWTYTFDSTPCPTNPPSNPPTHPVTPAGNGGANTGLNGQQPGVNTSFWNAGNTALFGGGSVLFILAALFGAIALGRIKRDHNKGEDGVEAQ
jgi:hypothetical protein